MVKIDKLKENIIKNKKNIAFSFGVVIVLLLLIILLNAFKKDDDKSKPEDLSKTKVYFSDEMTKDPNKTIISNENLSKEQCVGEICVTDVVISCYENIGNISYKITNKSKKKKSAYLKIVIDNYIGYIYQENLKPNKIYSGLVGYVGYDLRKTKDYKLKIMSLGEREAIVK